MYIWYSPLDGKCELFDYNPAHQAVLGPGDSILMVPPVGWDCE